MIERKNLKNIIWELSQKLSMVLYTRNLEFSVIRLIFLKYCVDNYIGASRIEDVQLCAKAQKMFAMKDVENGIHIIAPVLDYIDEAYGLNRILSGYDNLDEYARELFGENNSRQRKNVDTSDFRIVMDVLSAIDLEEKQGSNEIGKELVEILTENIVRGSHKNSYSGEITTRLSLCKLAGKILDVKSDEVFCDFVSGIGLSTLTITENSAPKIINVDINNSTVAIAAMLYIMSGIKNFKVYCADSLSYAIPEVYGDKIFVDAPLGMMLKKNEENEYTDSSSAVLGRVINDYWSDRKDAIAVMTMPPTPLFQARKVAVLRKELIERGLLKAVISLPSMWSGTTLLTNLFVLSREYNDEVVFINAANVSVSTKARQIDISGKSLLPADKIELIVDTINNKKIIEGFSNVIAIDEIRGFDYNLVPLNYIPAKVEKETITVAEIDAQLEKLYRQLLD